MPLPISIIICTRGRSDDLRSTLDSLADVRIPPAFAAELIVVEDGLRHDVPAAGVAFGPELQVRHLFEPQSSKSQKLNRAIAEACGTILLFSDDDVRFPPDWVERMCAPILTGDADAVAGGVRIAPHLLRPWMNHTHRAWLANTADYLSPDSPSEMCGANMAVSRDALRQMGGFDLELGPGISAGSEETLISWRLKQAGFRIGGALDVQVEHHFDARRLQYQSWLSTARQKGRARAYLRHHWHHEPVPWPRLRRWFFQTKILVRRAFSRRRRATEEGIAPWELSYEQDAAMFAHYPRERARIPRYPKPVKL